MKTMNIKHKNLEDNFLESPINHDYRPQYLRELKSFMDAGRGIIYFFRNEFHALIHFLAACFVIGLCMIFPVSRMEVMALVFSVALVWISEMLNTAIEKAMDFICLEKHEAIRIIKDVAAGAVLIASCAAAIIGALIFIPKIFHI